ncbi:MAG: dolichyl-phosphate-mannose--protein mannosyltransferase [Bacteroidales bacterium]|nr:dolichyl-phosphate-mannose--protein mannosyltransferase [Bacteroidales bacterium]
MKNFFKTHPVGCVILMSSLLLLPLISMRDFTPSNELRYLSIVDEAIADGHVFTFRNQGEPYADKPPLYFWLMMLCRTVFGCHSMPVLSMLSLIPAFVIVTIMDRWLGTVSRRYSLSCYCPVTRAAMALMMMSTALFLGMSVFLRMDMLMCMFIVLALYVFYRMYTGEGSFKVNSCLLPLFIFLALFTKGPVGLLVPPVTILVFLILSGKWRETGKYLGWKTWGIIAVLCAIWFTGVYIEGGKAYLNNLLFHQTVDRAVNAFHHKEPFWYYLTTIWYVTAPYSIVLIPVLMASFFTLKGNKMTEPELLFATAVISTVFMLSCFSSKLAIYLAPVFPFLVYLFPLVYARSGRNIYISAGFALPSAILAAAGIGILSILPIMDKIPQLSTISGQYGFIHSPAVYVSALILATGGIASIALASKTKSWQFQVMSISISMLLAVFAASFTIPQANDYIGYGNICQKILEMDPTGLAEVHTLHMHRPENMDAYLGHDIVDHGKDIKSFIKDAPDSGYLIVTAKRVSGNQELEEFLIGKETIECGPYTIYRLDSGTGHRQGTTEKEVTR